MTRDELKKLIRGTLATIVTPFDNKMKLDLARMTDLTRWWVENGLGTDVAPLKVAAAMGEGPDLSDEEWPHLLRTVVNAAGSDAVVMCGLKTKNTLHTIEDAKKAQDLGAVGLQIDLPMFHHPNQDDYVRYFTDISDAIDIGIMIYNTYWFGCESITAETLLRLADAEHVVAVKWDVPEGEDYDQMRQFAHIFNVIDNSNQPVRCHKNGGRGYISSTIPAYPQYDLEIWQLLEAQRYEEAQAQFTRVRKALSSFTPTKQSGGYRLVKGMMAAMGQPAGPTRPPTLPLDDQDIAELKSILKGTGWPVPE
ncbi:dihydrodipicolinate synthase family protein [Candidatus Poribacteria bacterium]|nr:dihydrodipicolinate synthase family protein [Candidatus Poribacteria bacterium]